MIFLISTYNNTTKINEIKIMYGDLSINREGIDNKHNTEDL